MKKLSVLIIAFATLFLTGCSFTSLEMNNLMHPPKATGEIAQIQSLIEKTVGSDIVFKYPQNGDYRTAIIMHDIDADGEEEAIAVYQTDNQDTQAYIIIIDKQNNEWQIKKNIVSQNTELDKVCFGDVNGNGKDDIILGWSSYAAYEKELTVILDENNDYTIIYPRGTYSDIVVNDFDDDGRAEILTLSLSRTAGTDDTDFPTGANAHLLKLDMNNIDFYILDSVFMDHTVVKYNSVKFGNIDENQKGVVIDGTNKKEQITTELIYWDKEKNKLLAPFYDIQTLSATTFLRDSFILSSDHNNDGIIELPKVEWKQENSLASSVYVISWYRFNAKTQGISFVESVIMNDVDSYFFVLPDKWKNPESESYKILLDYDSNSRTMTVYERVEYASKKQTTGSAILSISVFTEKEYEDLPQEERDNYLLLEHTQKKVYVAYIFSINELSISKDEILNNFKII